MMNKLVLLLSLSLLPHSAFATEELGRLTGSWPCFKFDELKEQLVEEHGEMPFISGNGVSNLLNLESRELELAAHGFYVFANPKTYEFTVVFRMGSDIGCMVSVGKEMGPVIQDSGI
jgi:hypothetical protein